jgi:hypothetical protein
MRKALVICALLGVVLPGRAAAEWHFTPSIGVTFAKDTNFTDLWGFSERRDRTFGVTVSRLGEGILGFEGLVALTPGFFEVEVPEAREVEGANRTLALMGNVVLTTPRLWTEYSLRPFVSGGVGLLHARGNSDPVFPIAADFAGFNIGGGAIGFLSDRTGVRFEMRYFGTLGRKDLPPDMTRGGAPAHLRYLTASIGLVIRTGLR